jgi:hypothetical protein
LRNHHRRDGRGHNPHADGRCGGLGASSDTGHALNANASGSQGLAAFQRLRQSLRPLQGTADGFTDPNGQRRRSWRALGHAVEVVIKARHLKDLNLRQAQPSRKGSEVGGRQLAQMILQPMQVFDQQVSPRLQAFTQAFDNLNGLCIERSSTRRGTPPARFGPCSIAARRSRCGRIRRSRLAECSLNRHGLKGNVNRGIIYHAK